MVRAGRLLGTDNPCIAMLQRGAVYKTVCQQGCDTGCLSKRVKKKIGEEKQEDEGDLFL